MRDMPIRVGHSAELCRQGELSRLQRCALRLCSWVGSLIHIVSTAAKTEEYRSSRVLTWSL